MASTYLQRTQTAGNRKTFTMSAWVKLAFTSNSNNIVIFNANTGTTDHDALRFMTTNQLEFFSYNGAYQCRLITNRIFRDINSFYHIVVKVDTTQATSSNRVKIYVNGVQETSFSTETYPSQNYDFVEFNNNSDNIEVGARARLSEQYFNGIMAHVHWVDGTAYDASTFGETDATTGIWKPKTNPSVTYGTNGFFLKFENSGSMGTDSSGNANNFTVNGTMTQTIDTPSNVFATMNGLSKSSYSTLSNGNLTSVGNTATDSGNVFGTLAVSKGKYYWECKASVVSTYPWIGVANVASTQVNRLLNGGGGAAGYSNNEFSYRANGQVYINDVTAATYTSFSTNDIVGIALDCDNKAAYVSINGTFVNSGDPTSGASKTGAVCTWSDEQTMMPSISNYNGDYGYFNFGNGYFGTTAVSSAQSPSDGIGIFEYTVPTGYKALCTKSINAQEYA